MYSTLEILPREQSFNKTALKNLRAEGKIPATLFGKSFPSRPVFINGRGAKIKAWHMGSMFSFKWEGQDYKATINEIQKDALGTDITHLSFHVVRHNEVTMVEIPVNLRGKAQGEKAGGMTTLYKKTLAVKGLPDALPEAIIVDIDNLAVDDKILISDIAMPKGIEMAEHNLDQVVAACTRPRKTETVSTTEITPTEIAMPTVSE